MILREAFDGTTRFDDFQSRLGISRNVLTTRLNKLVDSGILQRQLLSEDDRRLEYVVRPMDRDLFALTKRTTYRQI